MSKVQIVPRKGETALVNKFPGSEDKGYLILRQTKIEFGVAWAKPQVRTCLMKGDLDTLQQIVRENKSLLLPGNIVVKEYVESEVPEQMRQLFYDQRLEPSQQANAYYKRAGSDEDAITLTLNDEPIVRLCFFDGSGEQTDTLVKHDNGAQISELYKQKAEIAASLPGSGD